MKLRSLYICFNSFFLHLTLCDRELPLLVFPVHFWWLCCCMSRGGAIQNWGLKHHPPPYLPMPFGALPQLCQELGARKDTVTTVVVSRHLWSLYSLCSCSDLSKFSSPYAISQPGVDHDLCHKTSLIFLKPKQCRASLIFFYIRSLQPDDSSARSLMTPSLQCCFLF